MRDDRFRRLLMVCALCAPAVILAEDAPSLELLEFLGEWETGDGEWQDPLEFMQELAALDAAAQNVKVKQAEANEDEQDEQDVQ